MKVGDLVKLEVAHRSPLLESIFGKQPTSKFFTGEVKTSAKWDDANTVRITSDDDMVEDRVISLKNIISVNGVPFTFAVPTEAPKERKVDVPGSKGEIYTVTIKANGTKSCTCKGFGFRRSCKHTDNV